MNYYPFHLGDYAADTAHLEPMEDLIYRRMLDLYYRTEKPLPEPTEIARLIRLRDEAARVRDVLNEFFEATPEGYKHARCEREIASFRAMAEGGRKGAANRWAKARNSQAIATPLPTQLPTPSEPQCQPEPEPEPKERNTARKRAAPAALVSVDNLVEAGVERQHAADWLAVRKAKNLPLTSTAWADTQAEAVKAGISVAEAIRRAAAQGWAGFRASWLQAEAPRNQGPPITVPSVDTRADEFKAKMEQRAAQAVKPPAEVLALARKLGARA